MNCSAVHSTTEHMISETPYAMKVDDEGLKFILHIWALSGMKNDFTIFQAQRAFENKAIDLAGLNKST